MRLTLRTLLAWMDQVLAPAEQRALGEKVAASRMAPQLADRVRAAVSHARLSAPQAEGRSLADDPNTVAEYLDNVLPGDRLEAFERICIESDVNLADVASCHGILADMARGTADLGTLDAAGCQRLLAAMTTKAARLGVEVAASAAPQAPPRPQGMPPVVSPDSLGDPAVDQPPLPTRAPTVPRASAARRRLPLTAWLAAAAALLLLVALGGIFAWSLTRGGGREVASREPSSDEGRGAGAAKPRPTPAASGAPPVAQADGPPAPATAPPQGSGNPAPPEAHAERSGQAATAPVSVSQPADSVSPPAQPAGLGAAPVDAPSATPANDLPQAATTSAPPEPAAPAAPPGAMNRDVGTPPQAPLPGGDALVIVAPPPEPAAGKAGGVDPIVPPPPPAAAAVAPPQAAAAAVAAVASPRRALLRRAAGDPPARWEALAGDEVPAEGDELLAPPWCRPQFTCGDAVVRLEPNTRVVISRDSSGAPRLEVVFGRAVAWSEAAELSLGVTAGGLVGVVTAQPRRPVGIEVALEREAGSDPATQESRRRAAVMTGVGEAVWKQTAGDGGPADEPLAGIGPEAMLPARAAVLWTSADAAAAAAGPAPADAAWLRGGSASDPTQRAAADALATRLAAGGPLEQTLVAMASDRRAENRMIAVATLALLGEYEPLVAQLADESPRGTLYDGQWRTLEAMTVPLALARGANAAGRLTQALLAHAPADDGPRLVGLARGMTADAMADGGASAVVDALEADSLIVRRYAILRLLETAAADVRARSAYRADRPPALRREGVAWWRSQLERGRLGPPR